MKIIRRGLTRDHGWVELTDGQSDPSRVSWAESVCSITALKDHGAWSPVSSHRYRVELTPAEVAVAFLKMPPADLAKFLRDGGHDIPIENVARLIYELFVAQPALHADAAAPRGLS